MRNTLLCPFDTGKCIKVWQSRARFLRQEWPGHVYLPLRMKDSLPEYCLDGRRVHFTGIIFYSEPLLLREWSAKTSHCNGDAGLGEIHRLNMYVCIHLNVHLPFTGESEPDSDLEDKLTEWQSGSPGREEEKRGSLERNSAAEH